MNFLRRVCALLLLSGVFGCSPPPPPPPDPPKGALSLVPASAVVVGQVDVLRLHASPLWAKLVAARKNEPRLAAGFDELEQEAGWDLLTQLRSLTFAVPFEEGRDPSPMLLAEGTFDMERMLSWMRVRAKKIDSLVPALVPTRHRGMRLFEDAFRGRFGECVFFGHSVLAVGAAGSGRKAIDVSVGAEPSAMASPARAGLVAKPSEPATLWLNGKFDEHVRADLARKLGAELVDARLTVDVVDGLRARLHVTGVSERDAAAVEQSIREVMEKVRHDPGVVSIGAPDLVDRIAFSRTNNVLDVSLQVDESRLAALMEVLERATRRRGPIHPSDPI